MNPAVIRLVLADPHPVMLDGLRSHMQACPDVQVLACVQDGEAAWQAVQQHQPDALVLDLEMPRRSGLSLIEALRDAGSKTHPILFTSAQAEDVARAINLGVQGVVSKQRSHDALVQCIRQVCRGLTCLDQDLVLQSVSLLMERQRSHEKVARLLTPREVDVARMVTEGWPNKKIASKLCISEGTAKLHLHHIYQKLNCSGRMALMLYMHRHGLV